ncbi:hypothetical protein CHS0354_004664 [Potamilus streckersoni]|uniref:G-protein coupled receptors family 1 profile domain-containing protein n=1 Tax=Potamilus streckersoni TaxID=2493646 RepID=A0AAE0S4S9_9BIVA|nr:hypothetical protein CHS0354_004664 [Potamilus streckersoni]
MEENLNLAVLNDLKSLENIGGAIFVGALMIIGFIGNSLSLYIYFFRYNSSTYRVFVLCLAFIDMVACCVTMPFVLYMQRYPFMFEDSWGCRVMKLTTYFITIGSGVILLIIATERYRKVCVPHGTQILEGKAKISCIIGSVVSVGFSWPALVLYGSKSVVTNRANITGFACEVSDEYWHTPYPAIFKFVLMFVFIVSAIALIAIYSLIWRELLRRRRFREGIASSSPAASKGGSQTNDTTETSLTDNSRQKVSEEDAQGNKNGGMNEDSMNSSHKTHATNEVQKSSKKKGTKATNTVTFVLFLITAVFCVSFLPHLILRIIEFLKKSFVRDMPYGGRVMYHMFRWSFFINHMANPIIYGLFDRQFKSELQKMFNRFRNCLK